MREQNIALRAFLYSDHDSANALGQITTNES
jgi:hypothetical protein